MKNNSNNNKNNFRRRLLAFMLIAPFICLGIIFSLGKEPLLITYIISIIIISIISLFWMFVDNDYRWRLFNTILLGFYYSLTALILSYEPLIKNSENNNLGLFNIIIGLAVFPTAILTWLTRQSNKGKELKKELDKLNQESKDRKQERENNFKIKRFENPQGVIVEEVYHAINNLVQDEQKSIKVISDTFIKTQEEQNLDRQIRDLLINSLTKDKFNDNSTSLRQDILQQISDYYKRITKKQLALDRQTLQEQELQEQEFNNKKEELDKLEQILNKEYILYFESLALIEANLRKANLEGANLRVANLREANLKGANLRKATLISANLTGANLISANLTGANLLSANLTGANLISAKLEGANLIYANLKGANLKGANLISANLRYANLIYANLISAKLEGANLISANLKGATFFSKEDKEEFVKFYISYDKKTIFPEGCKLENEILIDERLLIYKADLIIYKN